ncbi:GGDEF domain-containing protein [Neobacillus cucumis]|uniref:GGDEF domain-containing protein n=1 Tax=Neobacillus cucumis TaxID=1740721 RepID=A0A2N5HJD3_9BACI|nr:diguanylate cyclase [Neobacillus cucumis]PLS05611.1 GGDEF domain-containing protein [Neobacillus cucumis]
MLKGRLYDSLLFLIALVIAFSSSGLLVDRTSFYKVLFIFWLFSCLYFHLRVFYKNGSINIDYGITYDLSLVLFAGPLGLFIFETIYRLTVYIYRKWTKTADPSEFSDTIYNIGCFVITNSIAYVLFQHFQETFQAFPFGYWVLLFILVCLSSYLSGTFMVIVFVLLGELKSFKEGFDFIFRSISTLDFAKVAITNGLLLIFLREGKWEMLFSVFLLNYIVSRSFSSKSQSIQTKLERDRFEQMAYTDFLTGVYNRTFMDKKMSELNQTGENVGIVVCDIDKFKSINDSYNHAVGDKVIQHFASTLKGYLTAEDYLFRSGGEEFTLCLRNRSFEDTVSLVNEIGKGVQNSVVNMEFQEVEIAISYTASFGLYFYTVHEQMPMEKAYILADQLMFQSKHQGRNRVSATNGLLNTILI